MEVLYICDRKACGDKCGDHCQHTSNIQHAANFVESEALPGVMVEIEKEAPGLEAGERWFMLSVILWAVTVAVTVAAVTM